MFDPHLWRRQFPILERKVHGKPLVYLDNAATTQKPLAVLMRNDIISNISMPIFIVASMRSVRKPARPFEGAREKVRAFLGRHMWKRSSSPVGQRRPSILWLRRGAVLISRLVMKF